MDCRPILTLDCGNTLVKASVVADCEVKATLRFNGEEPESLTGLLEKYDIHDAIFCSVGRWNSCLVENMRRLVAGRMLLMTHSTPVPLKVEYSTPSTLGLDRVAAAVGAETLSAGGCSLVVDAGTAITSDLVCGGAFKGGNISPGLKLRFLALHEHTASLPLVEATGELPLTGHDTATAIRSGVVTGAAMETLGFYGVLARKYPGLRLVMTGGDAPLLAEIIRCHGIEPIVEPNLIALGLRAIFEYNENE